MLGAVLRTAHVQHGVVTRAQLYGHGLNSDGVAHRVERGRLHPLGGNVFAVGTPHLTRRGRWMAAVLACGEGARLSHRSACALYGVAGEGGAIHVSVPAGRRPRVEGVVVHRRALAGGAAREGIEVVSVVQALVDLAACADGDEVEAAINAADRADLIHPGRLRAALNDHPRHPGVGALKRILDAHTFSLTDSVLERRFRPLWKQAGLPPPLTQQYVNGYRVDFFWPDLGLVVETDGGRFHRTAAQQTADRRRDQAHTAAGMTPLRFTHAQVAHEPRHVVEILTRTADRLVGRPGDP